MCPVSEGENVKVRHFRRGWIFDVWGSGVVDGMVEVVVAGVVVEVGFFDYFQRIFFYFSEYFIHPYSLYRRRLFRSPIYTIKPSELCM